MANMPSAEVQIDEALVTRLLREQHTDLAHLPVHTLSNGWDNSVFRLGQDFVVRLPRREMAVQLLRNEQLFLPLIAQLTSLALPVPVRTGVPSAVFPWPWTIAPWFDGEPAFHSAPSEHHRMVSQLADFVSAIHRPAPPVAPRNPVRGVPLRNRDLALRNRVTAQRFSRFEEIIALWDRLLTVPEWNRAPSWLHGDLHAANILAKNGNISAIIDFGDMCSGDPAVDLAAGWMLFERDDREHFQTLVTEATGADDALWQRARGWALNLATVMLAQSDDSPAFQELGRHTLAAALAD